MTLAFTRNQVVVTVRRISPTRRATEAVRLRRNCGDRHRLLELCALFDTLIADADGIDHPRDFNGRIFVGAEELHVIMHRGYTSLSVFFPVDRPQPFFRAMMRCELRSRARCTHVAGRRSHAVHC